MNEDIKKNNQRLVRELDASNPFFKQIGLTLAK